MRRQFSLFQLIIGGERTRAAKLNKIFLLRARNGIMKSSLRRRDEFRRRSIEPINQLSMLGRSLNRELRMSLSLVRENSNCNHETQKLFDITYI